MAPFWSFQPGQGDQMSFWKNLITYPKHFCYNRYIIYTEENSSPLFLATSGANPTIVIYNATGSLARFKNKNILFYFVKRSSLQRWRCSCKFKNLRIGSCILTKVNDCPLGGNSAGLVTLNPGAKLTTRHRTELLTIEIGVFKIIKL
jgi:hypothetical protein